MAEKLSFRRLMFVIKRELLFSQFFNPVKLIGAGVLTGIIVILATLGSYTRDLPSEMNTFSVEQNVKLFYNIGFFLGLCGMIGNINVRLSDKGEMINWITLPATIFEKYLSKLIMAFVVIPVYLFVVFGVSEFVRVVYYNIFYSEYPTDFVIPLNLLPAGNGLYEDLTMLFVFGSFFFFCSFIFRKNTLFKTVLSGVLLGAISLFVILGTFFVRIRFFSDIWQHDKYDEFYFNSIQTYSVHVMIQIFIWLFILFFLVWPYFRMKETELIHRF